MQVKKGFTLIEMLVVIGIITVLMGASIAGYSKMTKAAEKAKVEELVHNVATGLTAYYQQNGSWPKRLVNGTGRLDADQALVLAKMNCLSLSTDSSSPKYATKLIGYDRFGVVTPWATATIKRLGSKATLSTKVAGSKGTIEDHIVYYVIDVDGDGVIEGSELKNLTGLDRIRATAAAWCVGKSGGDNGKPWPYNEGGDRRGDVYSFTFGQTQAK